MKGFGWVAVAAVAAYLILRPKPAARVGAGSSSAPARGGDLAGAIGELVEGGIRLFGSKQDQAPQLYGPGF